MITELIIEAAISTEKYCECTDKTQHENSGQQLPLSPSGYATDY